MRWPYVRATRLGQAEERVAELCGVLRRTIQALDVEAEQSASGLGKLGRDIRVKALMAYREEVND